MKLRVIDRILIALSGLMLLALAGWLALDALGLVQPLSEATSWLLYVDQPQKVLIVICLCAVLILLGVYEVSVLFRRRTGKRGFISQKSENGEIAISVKSIKALVAKCAEKHGEIMVQYVAVEEARNGLIIKMKASLASGMNIPLAVGTLQKQVKQYITACSGVDVSEVRVKVDSTDQAVGDSPYAVADDAQVLPVEEPQPAPIPAEVVAPVEVPAETPEIPSDERELLTHQRLFSTVEEPAMVPVPPEMDASEAVPVVPPEDEIEAEVEQSIADLGGEMLVPTEMNVPEGVPEVPSEEEIKAEAERPIVDLADEATAPETDWIEDHEARWDAKADEVEAQEAQWDATAAQAEQEEADEAEEDDKTETTEE